MSNSSHPENQINFVKNFHDLLTTSFQKKINAICWKRDLIGNFGEIVKKVTFQENIKLLNEDELQELKLSEKGNLARKILLNDLNVLKSHGAKPILNIIKNYERDTDFPFLPTDVYSFHVDRSPIPVDTFLCTYYGEPSDIIANEQATQKILIPEIREELKKLYDGNDAGFEAFLSEYFFDLHYAPKPNAKPISLGIGNLWKLAVDHPKSNVLPCLHRAPKEKNGQSRLLLIC
ncbi:hypothetical protein H9W90_11255 [Polaribacter pectinis]|uniref:DUF1826 domain-containing protein n=1 Tax=Polaribacter pectinis TaxID=2738844 RepID=A0A7G9L821_9FLAO|nr:hypothetical protein [Polaribacter pectinis]QNM84770.1 hypothetical protein H9W90_11255 [Polaribacter pectinis]